MGPTSTTSDNIRLEVLGESSKRPEDDSPPQSCIGLADGTVHPANTSDHQTANSLLKDVTTAWSTLTLRTNPFPTHLFQHIHPNHQVLLSCKPYRPGCHQWRPAHTTLAHQIRELQPDVIVECYLDAKCYDYDPVELVELAEFNETFENVLEESNIVTVENAAIVEFNVAASLNDNFQELEIACPEWYQDTKAVHPQWIEHHQSRRLTKDASCPVCMEEAGSKVAHRHKKGDRQPGVMRVDLAAFEASADGNKYCLVAAVTIEVDKESKLLPIFVPMLKKDAVYVLAAIKEGLSLCEDRNVHQITGCRVLRIQADGGGEFSNEKRKALCWERNIICHSLQAINHPRMVQQSAWLVSSRAHSVEC